MLEKSLIVRGKSYLIAGDSHYLGSMGEAFEPQTTALLEVLCDEASHVVDIGANIGLTALALADLCPRGAVLAIEPVPATFALLERNLTTAGVPNVRTANTALGASEGSVSMYVDERNLATSFVVDIDAGASQAIPLTSLDALLERQGMSQVDVIKIDVEGCELEVLNGASATLKRCQPLVMLEMNHWCLNIFRRVALPDFRDQLLALFPYVYAVEDSEYLDFSDPLNAGHIYHAHVFENRYMNLLAGFDQSAMLNRLQRLSSTLQPQALTETSAEANPAPEPAATPNHAAAANNAEAQLHAILNSRSWKLTAPIRRLSTWLRG